jgi:hypothetical protein
MARIRTIKPEFPQSESMGRVSRDARLLFIQLWTLCDDEGRSRGDARLIKGLLYPYDELKFSQIDAWLDELERENCIVRYESDGSRYLAVCNWLNHQKIDRPSRSKIPEPADCSRILANPREGSCEDLRTKDQGSRTKEGTKDQGEATIVASVVFEHWQKVHNHPDSRLSDARRRVILKALKDYSADQLCESISGYKNSPFHMGQNDRGTVYDSLELMLRDAQKIDAGLAFARNPPKAMTAADLREASVAATILDWAGGA